MSRDFLLEIGTEEIPARFMQSTLEQLKSRAQQLFEEARLEWKSLAAYGTPRRLALYVGDLAERQRDLTLEIKGPAKKAAFDSEGKATRAALGFANSRGVKVEDLVVKDTGSGEYVFALVQEIGRPTREVLPEILPKLVLGLHFPKSMRWADQEMRFVRPIHWLVSLYGREVVPFQLGNILAGRLTYGHRFLHPAAVSLQEPREYFSSLEKAWVIVQQGKRQEMIREQSARLAFSVGGRVELDPDLLEEVTYLLEYPTAFMGDFAESFLELPEEVIITPMQEHQRYFPVRNREGALLPKFIAVRNGTEEGLEQVREGNEKVLAARLADAHFFFQEDLKEPLSDKVEKLKAVVFQERLGTVYEKTERLQQLVMFIGKKLGWPSSLIETAMRGAFLAKADLVTNMVNEFPELQGVMGGYYAQVSEGKEVAQGIREHYLPRFAGDSLPNSRQGLAISIADKIDTITGCFLAGLIPTGSQDPYALRRQSLGICHMLLEKELPLSLKELVDRACSLFGCQGEEAIKVRDELLQFFRQRLDNIFQEEKKFSYDVVAAVLETGWEVPVDACKRAEAVQRFKEEPAFDSLVTAFTRAANLAQKAAVSEIDPGLFQEEVERELYRCLETARRVVQKKLEVQDYRGVLQAIAALREPIDDFFDGVLVMAPEENLKKNRLSLLKGVVDLALQVADLSQLVPR
ncbi:MAG: glycine--tRNA ligase subunit beta [Bacillota bacterium]